MAPVLLSGLAVAAMAVAALLASPAAVDAGSSCVAVSGHAVLSAPGGVLTLPDGRQLAARTVEVGGCATRPDWVTGTAHPNGASNYTSVSRGPTTAADSHGECVTGVGEGAAYTSFQAVLFTANGFRFTPSFVMEDIDAQDDDLDPAEGWRETMASVGMAGGRLVRPRVTVAEGSLVAVLPFGMPEASLAAVEFPVVSGLSIEGVAYVAPQPKNCPFLNDTAGECAGFVQYTQPIDTLLIIYAVTQTSLTLPESVAFFSAISLPCGCQCAAHTATATRVVPTGFGTCKAVSSASARHSCDDTGDLWCETHASRRYVMTGSDGQSCAEQPSTVQRRVSAYEPVDGFTGATQPTTLRALF